MCMYCTYFAMCFCVYHTVLLMHSLTIFCDNMITCLQCTLIILLFGANLFCSSLGVLIPLSVSLYLLILLTPQLGSIISQSQQTTTEQPWAMSDPHHFRLSLRYSYQYEYHIDAHTNLYLCWRHVLWPV